MRRALIPIHLLIAAALGLTACNTVDVFEKTVAVPDHAWANSFRPSFHFTIKDSSSPYQFYLVLRHNEKYNYNNIYINLYIHAPGRDSAIKIQENLPLATREKWTGKGMDDIYEHRIELGSPEPLSIGDYSFTLEQIMREDPLENVLDVGIRVEKK